ncbi:MAG: SDR family oxidoreductase [Alphaproteobacteria bacterium]|nr:SDR family oxidoreductase [Alphaproteobacteria bacterium]
MNRLFCFGMGFCAKALSQNLAPRGWAIGASTRGPVGYQSFPFDSGLSDALHGTTHVLISAPPEGEGDPVLAMHAATLSAISPPLKWLGYLSTTGVYGDHGGNWIDETTPVAPKSPRARRRVEAELAWLEWGANANVPIHIFRLAGIYGPGRSPIDALRAGTARRIVKPGQVFSRIHVDDVATVLAASMAHPNSGRIYNVCDDEPAPPHVVVEYAASLIGVSPPPLETFEGAAQSMSEMALSFYAESKRVGNQRVKSELAVTLLYPTYREGLRACNSR